MIQICLIAVFLLLIGIGVPISFVIGIVAVVGILVDPWT